MNRTTVSTALFAALVLALSGPENLHAHAEYPTSFISAPAVSVNATTQFVNTVSQFME